MELNHYSNDNFEDNMYWFMGDQIIYKYLSLKDALQVVMKKTIKFSNPLDFNDPFDCYERLIEFNLTEEFLLNHIKRGIYQLEEKEKLLPMSELVDKLNKEVYTFDNPDVKALFRNVLKEAWISCFSKTYDNVLMWSHYGGFHSGVCIGFSVSGLLKTFDFILSNIEYVHEFTIEDYCENPEKALKHLVNTKSDNWRYEQEIRLRTRKDKAPSMSDSGIISIDSSSIKKIVLGCKCPVDIKSIRTRTKALEIEDAKISRLELSSNSFSLNEVNI